MRYEINKSHYFLLFFLLFFNSINAISEKHSIDNKEHTKEVINNGNLKVSGEKINNNFSIQIETNERVIIAALIVLAAIIYIKHY